MSHQPSKSNEETFSEFAGYLRDWAITEPELSLILGNLNRILAEKDAETKKANTKGYDAGLADGTGNPLIAIEQMREKAVEEERKKIIKKLEVAQGKTGYYKDVIGMIQALTPPEDLSGKELI